MVELGFAPVFVSQGNNQEDRQMDEGLKWSWIRREWHSSGRCCHQSHLFHARTLDKHQEWDAALANFQLCCFTISWSRWGFGRRENSLRKGVATIRKVEIKHEPPSPFCPTDISTATSHTVITSMFQPSLHVQNLSCMYENVQIPSTRRCQVDAPTPTPHVLPWLTSPPSFSLTCISFSASSESINYRKVENNDY